MISAIVRHGLLAGLFFSAISGAAVPVPRYLTCELDKTFASTLRPADFQSNPSALEVYLDLITPFIKPDAKELTNILLLEFRDQKGKLTGKTVIPTKLDEAGNINDGNLSLLVDVNGVKLKLAVDMQDDRRENFTARFGIVGDAQPTVPYVCNFAPEQTPN